MGKNNLKRWIAAMIAVVLVAGCLPESLQDKIEVKREVKAATTLQNPRIEEAPSMTAGQIVTWDCVWFGSYPQMEIVDEASTCGTNGKAWGTTSDYVENDALYDYLESATGWDSNGDITYNGTKYRRIKKNDATYFNDGSDSYYKWTSSDTYHYFRYDPIKWRVLSVSDEKAFLLADKALDDQMYNTTMTDVAWKTSTIRSWLNGYGGDSKAYGTDYSSKNFIGSAFSDEEQGAILDTSVVNSNNIQFQTSGGDDTTDKIFLLSEAEVYDTDAAKGYGFVSERDTGDEARRCQSTTYAKAMGTWSHTTVDSFRGNCFWWLRSPGEYANTAANVLYTGCVDYSGLHVDRIENGVRPALYLNLSSSNLWSYAGTVCSDGDEVSAKDVEDKAAADQVTNLINKMTSNDPESVKAAREAYDKLTVAQKKLVSADILKKLTDAENALKEKEPEEKTTEKPKTPTNPTKPTTPIKPKSVLVKKISITGISHMIASGRKIRLTAKVLPENASNQKLKWTTSNKKIATVTQTGKVEIKKSANGKKTVKIIATAKDGSKKKAIWKITVMKGSVKKITVKGYKRTLKAGNTMQMKAIVEVTKSKPVNKKLKWSSSNTKWASVTQKGKVKAKIAGKGKTVKITVQSTDGTNKKVVKRIKIK